MKPSKSSQKKRARKKTKPSSPSPPQVQAPAAAPGPPETVADEQELDDEEEENRKRALDLDWLAGAFSSMSLAQIVSAYDGAGQDPFMAAGILGTQLEDPVESVEAGVKVERGEKRGKKKEGGEERKLKRVAASTGMVASVIGKGYAKPSSNCGGGGKREVKEENGKDRLYNVAEGEEFLCSMLGDDSELGMAVVKDVLGQCGYDVEKALDALLDISATSFNPFMETDGSYLCSYGISTEGSQESSMSSYQSSDMASDSTSQSSQEVDDILQHVGFGFRDDTAGPANSKEQASSRLRVVNPALQQKVLESLFNIPDNAVHEPNCMNWKKAVQQVESFGKGLEFRNGNITERLLNDKKGKEDEYQVCRSVAQKHWETMRGYYQKAAVAYSRGERANAAQLSETGRIHRDLARKADENASREIFEARNKGIKNTVTIDLHGQHVSQGMGLLKLHLLLFTYIPSVQFLRVITGCGNSAGKGKLKRTVIALVKREGIEWCEENSGTILLRLDGLKEYTFTEEDDNDSDES